MTPFEDAVRAQLAWLVRAGVPPRGLRLSVHELVVARISYGPLGAREVTDTVEAALRAACRLVRDAHAPDELVEIVYRATLDAVRGHGGTTSRWLAEATGAAQAVVDELASTSAGDPWPWLARRLSRI